MPVVVLANPIPTTLVVVENTVKLDIEVDGVVAESVPTRTQELDRCLPLRLS